MDDVARAAGLSRQGLYLKFSTKNQLFKAALEHLVSRLLKKAHEVSGRAELNIERRLVLIFDAIHGDIGLRSDMAELLDHARSKHNDIVTLFEKDLVEIVEALLIQTGTDKQWLPARITAKELAEHLLLSASGIKIGSPTESEYNARMAVSIALVMRGAAFPIISSEYSKKNTL